MKKRIIAVLTVMIMLIGGCGKSAKTDKSLEENAGQAATAEPSKVPADTEKPADAQEETPTQGTGQQEDSDTQASQMSAPIFTEKTLIHPPFFKVEDPATGGVVYMLGTMHVGLEEAVYPDEMYAALDASDTVAFEVDIIALQEDAAQLTAALMLLLSKDGPASEYFGEDYEEIKSFFVEKEIYMSALEYYIPAMWSSLLENLMTQECGFDSEYGADNVLLRYAKEHDKEIYEIETAILQYRVIAGEALPLQIMGLMEMVEDYDGQKDALREMYLAWSSGDEAYFEEMFGEYDDIPEEYEDEYADYYAAMYTQRQENMANCVIRWLQNGEKAFMAVGAAHYYGTPDILDYLEDAGYTVEKLFK